MGGAGARVDHRGEQPALGHGVDEQIGDVVAGLAVRAEDALAVDGRVERRPAGPGHLVGLGCVHRPLVELVHAADVVAVGVGGDGQQPVLQLALDEVAQRTEAERRVDDDVGIPAPDVPDVAPQQGVHVGLGDQRDAVTDVARHEPRIGDGQIEHRRERRPAGRPFRRRRP